MGSHITYIVGSVGIAADYGLGICLPCKETFCPLFMVKPTEQITLGSLHRESQTVIWSRI